MILSIEDYEKLSNTLYSGKHQFIQDQHQSWSESSSEKVK